MEAHMRWINDIKSITGLSINDLKRYYNTRKLVLISEQHSHEEETGQCLIQRVGSGKLFREFSLVHPRGEPGVLETRRTSSLSSSSFDVRMLYNEYKVLIGISINILNMTQAKNHVN